MVNLVVLPGRGIKLSAFRNPMDYDAVSIFNDFGDDEKFNDVLNELVDRGLLFRDEKSNKFDMHPVVRKYCYDRLEDREGVHSRLRDYFTAIPTPEKIESVDDLAHVIELYHHTVRVGRYDEASELFRDRLHNELYFRFGAYQMIIELLRALFPDGEAKLPRLKNESNQAWTLNALANSYSFLGQPRNAVNTFQIVVDITDKLGDKGSLVRSKSNLAFMAQIPIGELNAAEANLRQGIEISREIKDEFAEAVIHKELGRLFAYQGKFGESEKEITKAFKTFEKLKYDYAGNALIYYSFCSILKKNADEAINYTKKALELGEKGGRFGKLELNIIRAEYLLGAAHLMKGNLQEAQKHLNEAFIRDRKINLVEYEPDILLELAKLRFKQKRKPEAFKFSQEALQIADRCEYRLKQADIHNFLTEFYLDAGDIAKAREHGELAKERAECGYVPALEKAEKLLKDIDLKVKSDS